MLSVRCRSSVVIVFMSTLIFEPVANVPSGLSVKLPWAPVDRDDRVIRRGQPRELLAHTDCRL